MMVSRRDVLARWAYSEILGARSSRSYDIVPDIIALRVKRGSGVSFDMLTANDRDQLVFGWDYVRGAFSLAAHLVGIKQFREERLIRSQIAPLFVPSGVSNLAMMPFERFIETQTAGDADPRSEGRIYADVPADPITVGRCSDGNVLVDGYHRAVSFWRTAPDGAFILGYMPV